MDFKKKLNKALSSEEVLDLIDHKANLMLYADLHKYDNINQILGPHKACIILYQTQKNFGHWVCVFKRGKLIEVFDSYGMKPDDELKFVPEYFRRHNNMMYPHLTYLLYKSGLPVEYNHDKLQKQSKDISTCGRWVALRLMMRHMPLTEFVKLVKSDRKYNADKVAVIGTKEV